MTIASTTNRMQYAGAGLTGPYAFNFRLFAATDLTVIKRSAAGVDATLAYVTDWTLATGTTIGDASGSITLAVALAVGETLVLLRVPVLTQQTSLANGGPYFGKTIEDQFDRAAMIDQAQQGQLDRSLKLAASLDPAGFNLLLTETPTGKVLTGTGNGIGWSSLDASAVALPGNSRTVATLSAYLDNNKVFDVKDYGAVGDYASHPLSTKFATLAAAQAVYPHAVALTDELDWAAIQYAIAKAQAVRQSGVTTGALVLCPTGIYLVNRPIVIASANAVPLLGEGMKSSVIVATAAMTAVLQLGDAAAQLTWQIIRDLAVDGGALRPGGGAALANYAIYGQRVDNAHFDGVRTSGALLAGCSMGNGWSNIYIDCHWVSNTGDGFQTNNDFASSNNAATFLACLALGNSGFGYRLRGGFGAGFIGGGIEQNAKGGVFARGVMALSFTGSIYFEQNGAVGYTFTSPGSTLVKAHVLLANTSATDLDIGGGPVCQSVTIGPCFVSTGGYEDAFIWASGMLGAEIRGNQATIAAGGVVPLLKLYAATANNYGDVSLSGNEGWATPDLVFSNIPTTAVTNFKRWKSQRVPQQNYAEPDFLRWQLISGSGGGTFRRSASTYRSQPVWEINGGTGQSDFWGFQLDLSLYPDLQSKTVYFGFWAQMTLTGMEIVAYCQGNVSASSTGTNTAWKWIEAAITLPASGIVSFAIYGLGMAVGQSVRFTEPTLAIVGADGEDFYKAPWAREWAGTAAPVAGTWILGDRVKNRAPAVASPKAWVCTVAGAPGTWVSEGNL